jgi:hypothetical protein
MQFILTPFSRLEVADQAWHTVDRRNEKDGIIINGLWYQLALHRNAMWTIETPTNQ